MAIIHKARARLYQKDKGAARSWWSEIKASVTRRELIEVCPNWSMAQPRQRSKNHTPSGTHLHVPQMHGSVPTAKTGSQKMKKKLATTRPWQKVQTNAWMAWNAWSHLTKVQEDHAQREPERGNGVDGLLPPSMPCLHGTHKAQPQHRSSQQDTAAQHHLGDTSHQTMETPAPRQAESG